MNIYLWIDEEYKQIYDILLSALADAFLVVATTLLNS